MGTPQAMKQSGGVNAERAPARQSSRPSRVAARRASSAVAEEAGNSGWDDNDDDDIEPVRQPGQTKTRHGPKAAGKGSGAPKKTAATKKATPKKQAKLKVKSRAAPTPTPPSSTRDQGGEVEECRESVSGGGDEPNDIEHGTKKSCGEEGEEINDSSRTKLAARTHSNAHAGLTTDAEEAQEVTPASAQRTSQNYPTTSEAASGPRRDVPHERLSTPMQSPRKPRLPHASGARGQPSPSPSPTPSPRKPPTPRRTAENLSQGRTPKKTAPIRAKAPILPQKRREPPTPTADTIPERRVRSRQSSQSQAQTQDNESSHTGGNSDQERRVPRAGRELRRDHTSCATNAGERPSVEGDTSQRRPVTAVEVSLTQDMRTMWRDIRLTYKLVEELKDKMEGMDVTLAEIRSSISAKNAVARTLATGAGAIAKYEAIMKEFVPHATLYFPDRLWCEVIFWATIEHVYSSCQYETITVDEFLVIMESIIFSLVGNKSLDWFTTTDVGKKASQYRKLVLKKAFEVARSGKYPMEQDKKAVVESDGLPYWLQKNGTDDYVLPCHLEEGQKINEEIQSHTDGYKRRVKIGNKLEEPHSTDVAEFVVSLIYKHMSEVFRKRRRRLRSDFTELFGYLFVSWKEHGSICVDDQSIDMRWVQASADNVVANMSSIPESHSVVSGGKSASMRNHDLFSKTAGRPELLLWISHDIVLLPAESEDDDTSGPAKAGDISVVTYPHRMSMATIILGIFRSWSGYSLPASQLMRLHKDTLRVLYALACPFREVTSIVKYPPVSAELRSVHPEEPTCSPKKAAKVRKFFDSILTAPSNIAAVISKATTEIPYKLYKETTRTLEQTIVSLESRSENMSTMSRRASALRGTLSDASACVQQPAPKTLSTDRQNTSACNDHQQLEDERHEEEQGACDETYVDDNPRADDHANNDIVDDSSGLPDANRQEEQEYDGSHDDAGARPSGTKGCTDAGIMDVDEERGAVQDHQRNRTTQRNGTGVAHMGSVEGSPGRDHDGNEDDKDIELEEKLLASVKTKMSGIHCDPHVDEDEQANAGELAGEDRESRAADCHAGSNGAPLIHPKRRVSRAGKP